MRGLERRVAAGWPDVRSVASLFVSRWDKATLDKVPAGTRDRLGIAVSAAELQGVSRPAGFGFVGSDSPTLGARPQRLLFASTGVKDPSAPDTLYVTALAAPNTVDTMPEETLLAFGEHCAGPIRRDAARRRGL